MSKLSVCYLGQKVSPYPFPPFHSPTAACCMILWDALFWTLKEHFLWVISLSFPHKTFNDTLVLYYSSQNIFFLTRTIFFLRPLSFILGVRFTYHEYLLEMMLWWGTQSLTPKVQNVMNYEWPLTSASLERHGGRLADSGVTVVFLFIWLFLTVSGTLSSGIFIWKSYILFKNKPTSSITSIGMLSN